MVVLDWFLALFDWNYFFHIFPILWNVTPEYNAKSNYKQANKRKDIYHDRQTG